MGQLGNQAVLLKWRKQGCYSTPVCSCDQPVFLIGEKINWILEGSGMNKEELVKHTDSEMFGFLLTLLRLKYSAFYW